MGTQLDETRLVLFQPLEHGPSVILQLERPARIEREAVHYDLAQPEFIRIDAEE